MNLNRPPGSASTTKALCSLLVLWVALWASPAQAKDGAATVTDEGSPPADVALAVDTPGGDGDAVSSESETIHPWDNNENRDTSAINGVIRLPGASGKNIESHVGLDVPPLSKSGADSPRPDNIGDVGNFPNPFNAQTQIRFTLKTAGDVEVRIFNSLGQTVRQVRLAGLTAGSHSWVWDGHVHRGGTAPSGVYFYRVESGGSAAVQRMVLLK